jgi:phosphoglycolate phosphatase
MLLPISNSAKVTLWVILFGLAKATQYTGLAIVGVEGWRRIKSRLKRNREDKK